MDTNYVSIPGYIASELLRLGDGDAALLYLFLTANGGGGVPDDAARSFGWSAARLRAASDTLLTLITAGARDGGGNADDASAKLPDAEAPPAKPSAKRSALRRDFPELRGETERKPFQDLLQEVQNMFGRELSADELIRLLGIYNNLKLPPEVILQLIRYCMTDARRRGESSSPPAMRYIEKVAYTWEREGIFSLEAAERYIKEREAQYTEAGLIKKALQINGRELTLTESKYVKSWLALGFGADEVLIAYDRTVTKTGQLAWSYMDKIINNWHGKGLHTAAEITERDTRADKPPARSKASGKAPSRAAPDGDEFERMKRLLSGISGKNADKEV
ncbi:MAG: DnaD domain protein [Oscillospiraceae bacterium]|jgi:DNA replication protein DnaD|nr:DnaD domain protein [Oscillospiraceae bacterium]